MNAIWAVRSLGIDPATGDEIFLTKDGETTTEWKAEDQVVCGDAMPDCPFRVLWNKYGLPGNFPKHVFLLSIRRSDL